MKYKVVEVKPGEIWPPVGCVYHRQADAIYSLENDFNVGTSGSGYWSTDEGLKQFAQYQLNGVNDYEYPIWLVVQDLEPERNEFGIVSP